MPSDITSLKQGQARLTVLLNEDGGILDDLMAANLGDDTLCLVVNSACKDQDLAQKRGLLWPGYMCNGQRSR